MIRDDYGRPVTSLRISVTPECNFNCIYCHHEGVLDDSSDLMSPVEIERIVKIAVANGVRKIKFTGGEPLLRADIVEIVRKIAGIEGIKDISMTTNGYLLDIYAKHLKEAGLDRVNISLDTLDKEIFSMVTRGGDLSRVLEGIDTAVDAGLSPVKLNMVVMKEINEKEIAPIMEKFSGLPVILQLIEIMDCENNNGFFERYFFDLDDLESRLGKDSSHVQVRNNMQGRRQYTLGGNKVEVVKPMHNTDFCIRCTRIRITSDGRFKPCLMRGDNLIDFLRPMRNGSSQKELEGIFFKAVKNREPFFKNKIIPKIQY